MVCAWRSWQSRFGRAIHSIMAFLCLVLGREEWKSIANLIHWSSPFACSLRWYRIADTHTTVSPSWGLDAVGSSAQIECPFSKGHCIKPSPPLLETGKGIFNHLSSFPKVIPTLRQRIEDRMKWRKQHSLCKKCKGREDRDLLWKQALGLKRVMPLQAELHFHPSVGDKLRDHSWKTRFSKRQRLADWKPAKCQRDISVSGMEKYWHVWESL